MYGNQSLPRYPIAANNNQFLNSVLSSIDGGASPIPVPEVRSPATTSKKPNDYHILPVSGGKRKAEDEIQRPNDKHPTPAIARTERSTLPGVSSNSPRLETKLVEGSSLPKGINKSQTTATSPTVATSNPPKKGSYQEILARAKQAQALQVGTIVHKPKEKLSSKKEIALQKEIALKNKKGQKVSTLKSAPGSKSNSPTPSKIHGQSQSSSNSTKATTYQGTSKSKSQPSSYQGTAKPKVQAGYKGTMKAPVPSSLVRKKGYDSEPDQARPKHPPPARRKELPSDEEEEVDDDDDEERYDYASEDYSDMDAGFDDVEEEDQEAARLARKEDDYEKMMLEEMKRQKEERKRRLVLAAERDREMRRR